MKPGHDIRGWLSLIAWQLGGAGGGEAVGEYPTWNK